MRATLSVTLTLLAAGGSFVQAQTINLKAGKAQSSAPVQNRIATELPPAPDLATAYFYVEKLPVMLPGGGTFLASTYALNNADHIFGIGGGTVPIIWNGSSVVFAGPSNYRISSVSVGKLNDFSDLVVNRVTGAPEGAVFSFTESAGFTLQRTLAGRVVHLINDAGWLVATQPDDRWDNEEGYWGRHLILRGSAETPIKLPHDATRGAVFSDQNLFGEIVGSADPNYGNTGARAIYVAPDGQFRWLPGDAIFDQAHAINVHGQIVGQTAVPDGPFYASSYLPAFWENGRGGKIETLPTGSIGYEYAYANGINRWGQIVGHTSQGAGLWINKKQVDLTGRLINPDNLTVANLKDINDNGVMLGETNSPNYASFRLRPVWLKLAVDANRDGVIQTSVNDVSDTTSTAMPFRFWLNDDIDGVVSTTSETEEDDRATGTANFTDSSINGKRDLEDFSRLNLYLKGLGTAISTGKLRVGLKWKEIQSGAPSIKVWRNLSPLGGSEYLSVPAVAEAHLALTSPGLVEGTTAYIIPQQFWIDSGLNDIDQLMGHLLFEGCTEGVGLLVFTLHDANGIQVFEGSGVWIDLKQPHKFVQRWTCGDGDLGMVQAWQLDSTKSGSFTAPANDEEKDLVLYVHGYNMKEFEKQRWIETAFKRLYWLGYRGRVGGFTWPCAQSFLPFDRSELRAWQAGAELRSFLTQLKSDGYRVHIVAHSQGNVVVSEALRQWRESGNLTELVATFIASQAAIAGHCFNPQADLFPFPSNLDDNTPNVYSRYWKPGSSDRLPETWPEGNASYLAPIYLSGTAGRFSNFFNDVDYALTGDALDHGAWELTNKLKPNDTEYVSYSSADGFRQRPGGGATVFNLVFPDDRFGIFAYGAEARSRALGARQTGGVFSEEINLRTAFGYGEEHIYHSAQFRSFYAQRWGYWRQVLLSCAIPVRATP